MDGIDSTTPPPKPVLPPVGQWTKPLPPVPPVAATTASSATLVDGAPSSGPRPFGRSEQIDQLGLSLAKAQAEITFASKDSANPHFKSKYADLASVWEACRGPLTANGLSVTQLCFAEGTKVTVSTVLLHASGQFVQSDLAMTAEKNTPQAIGSAITYARRYALAAIAGVAQDDDDGNAASGRR